MNQNREILYLCHCVPNPPDKGERIRSHHELILLARHYRVHLVCFARSVEELRYAAELKSVCASVFVELHTWRIRAGALFRFLGGSSLTAAFYFSPAMRRQVRELSSEGLAGAVVYSTAMFQYLPADSGAVLDMVDVDSEKWRQYAEIRTPAFLYRTEAKRLHQLERDAMAQASCTFLATEAERRLMNSYLPCPPVRIMENGVDFEYFDPTGSWPGIPGLPPRFIVFIGVMDYYPNVDAVCWFSDHVLPQLQRRIPELGFLVVGRNPNHRIKALASRRGIFVTGAVSDVRPYLAKATLLVAPLRIARGIQNKVLEALAMGKPVAGSAAVCRTFGKELPEGVIECSAPEEYVSAIEQQTRRAEPFQERIRESSRHRFSWFRNLEPLHEAVALLCNNDANCSVTGT